MILVRASAGRIIFLMTERLEKSGFPLRKFTK